MKTNKKILTVLLTITFLIVGVEHTELQAQNKKYWKQVEKAEKKRAKYYKDVYKAERKYHKEAAKRQEKYYKDLRKYGRRNGPPAWAPAYGYDGRNHIYFTDYRTFYDPYRGGYVYVDGGNWRFSVNLPPFMVNVNLGNARTRVIRDYPISRHPEDFYDDWYEDWDD